MVGLSLLVACAYLAMLASARALARRRELAVRMALGASRSRVAAQLTWESVLLAMAGGGLGVLFAWGAERALATLMKRMSTDTLELRAGPGAMVLLFTLGLMGMVVVLSGVWPAWRASKVDPAADIKEGEASIAGRRTPRMGAWLVPVQIAFSLVIVTMAALMGSTVARLLAWIQASAPAESHFCMQIFRRGCRRRAEQAAAHCHSLYFFRCSTAFSTRLAWKARAFRRRIRWRALLTWSRSRRSQLPAAKGTDDSLIALAVTPGYFDVFGMPLLAGRNFTLDDKGE